MRTLRALLKSMRVHSYIKNGFIAAPLIFTRQLTNISTFLHVMIGVGLFCFLSSSVYLMNDIRDIDLDRNHPVNRRRPLAAGELSVPTAALVSLLFGASALLGSYLLEPTFFGFAAAYLVLQATYSSGLKHIAVLESLIIAGGFVLRVMAGSSLVHEPASEWIILSTFFLALVLAFGKRKSEKSRLQTNPDSQGRPVLSFYPSQWLDAAMGIAAACAIMTYSLYTISPKAIALGGHAMVYTVFPVVLGLLRFLQQVATGRIREDLARSIFRDPLLGSTLLTWVAMLILIVFTPFKGLG